jgi:AAA ATPase domain
MSASEPPTPRGLSVSKRAFSVPARTLGDAVRLCDPWSPLNPSEDAVIHEDLTKVRGGDGLAKIARNIRRAGGVPTLHFVSGHIGSGKTTELLRMMQQLRRAEGASPPAKMFFLDAEERLDRSDIDLEDILMALWALVYEEAPEAAARALGPIWKRQISEIAKKIVTGLPGEAAEAVSKVVGYVRLAGPEKKQEIRNALGSAAGPLVEGLNLAFQEMQRPDSVDDEPAPLVILIDNLEKLTEAQRINVERLYLERMVALKRLEAHMVITLPIYLPYTAAGAGLIGLYGGKIVVLPMIETRRRVAHGGGDNPAGIEAMTHLLEKRVRFEDLFEEKRTAAERIARFSGGCIRHALRILVDAVNEHDNPPVTAASLDRAAAGMQADFERALPEAYVPVLRQIAKDNRFPDNCPDEMKRNLLRHLFVLEYQNGAPDPWYAVHPLVERCRKYREHA